LIAHKVPVTDRAFGGKRAPIRRLFSVERSIHANFCDKHWAPILCGIDQHLNG